jgi:carbamoyltransferase
VAGADLAASVQVVFEEVCFSFLRHVQRETGMKNLACGGGVALNCAANGKLFAETPFENVYIPPAPNDAGIAMGSALYVAHQILGQPRGAAMTHAYYGPEFGDREIRGALEAAGIGCESFEREADLLRETAARIARGSVTGWFQGPHGIRPPCSR